MVKKTLRKQTAMIKRILIIDDEQSCLISLETMLFHRGYNITKARNANEALALLSSKKEISLILSDVDMPGMSGLELLSLIKQDSKVSHIPVILQTATEESSINEGLKLGANAVLRKPFNKLQLFEVIDQLSEDSVFQKQKLAA